MSGHDVLMMSGVPRVEVFTGTRRRRRWSREEKAAIVAESHSTSVGDAAARHGLSKAQLFNWRRHARASGIALGFARVELASLEPQGEPSSAQPVRQIEIASRGITVRIGTGADVGMVTAIIHALHAAER